MAGVSIQNLTRRPLRGRRVFSDIAASVLPEWGISLVFIGPTRARALNKRLRNKNYIPNVLSYTVGEKSGEIIICLQEAARQAPAYGMSARVFVLYLFIHGLLHLKGWAHGGTMEQCERRLVARFAAGESHALTPTHGTTHRHRHRHRHVSGKNSRRRGTLR